MQRGIEQLQLRRSQQTGCALFLIGQKGEKIRRLVGVDAPGRSAELRIQRGQGKHALPV